MVMGATCWPDVPQKETARNAEGSVLAGPAPQGPGWSLSVESFFFTSMEFLKVVCKDRGGPSRIDVPPGWVEVRPEPALIPSVFLSVSVPV